jgi:hypothetical protein
MGSLASGIDLFWLPLGAGGHCVRLNGRIYEAFASRLDGRPSCDLYHSALEVRVPRAQYVIESAPIRPSDGPDRGVIGEGPVGTRWAGRVSLFRYELRVWPGGHIPDIGEAVESPVPLSSSSTDAQRLLTVAPLVPKPTWGRDELDTGEMWNSNSFIAWLITVTGLDSDAIHPPPGDEHLDGKRESLSPAVSRQSYRRPCSGSHRQRKESSHEHRYRLNESG